MDWSISYSDITSLTGDSKDDIAHGDASEKVQCVGNMYNISLTEASKDDIAHGGASEKVQCVGDMYTISLTEIKVIVEYSMISHII